MDERPIVRPELEILPVRLPQGRAYQVRDPIRERVFWFGPLEIEVLRALTGRHSIQELARQLARRTVASCDEVLELISRFRDAGLLAHRPDHLGWVHGMAEAVEEERELRGQLRLVRAGEVLPQLLPVQAAPDPDCQPCRLRCCSFAIRIGGDEVAGVVEAARAVDVESPRLLATEQPQAEEGIYLLAHDEEECCVLLDEDDLCRVHAAFGLERKPVECQLYPGIPMLTPDGPRMALRPSCSRPRITRDATTLAAYRRLLERVPDARARLAAYVAPERVCIVEAVEVPWSVWRDFEEAAGHLLAAAPDGRQGLLAVVEELRRRFRLEPAAASTERAQTLVGALSSLAAEGGAEQDSEVLVRLASGEDAGDRWCRPESLQVGLDALEPLRFETALAGMGFLTLVAALVDRDARAEAEPRETAARWYRRLALPEVRRSIARSWQTLEGMALDPSL